MIPAQADTGTPESERKVFSVFQRQLPSSWTVFHARRLVIPSSGRGPARECEIDFLVVDPQRGMLGLEVKGGILAREEDGWRQNGHHIKAPGAQAQHAVHVLEDYLGSKRLAPSFGWGVVFPDACCPPQLGPDLPAQFVVDANTMPWADKAVDAVFRSSLGAGCPMTTAEVERLLRSSLRGSPWRRRSLQRSRTRRLRSSGSPRISTTSSMAEIPRLGIKGGAGTGKSLVAMERARRLAAEGRRVLLLCYNRGLATYLQARADSFAVSTFHSLCGDLAKRAGLADVEIPTGPDAQKFWQETAPNRLMAALDLLSDERYDAVIVDEGQDFFEYWWLAVLKLLRHPDTDVLWVFYDPRQDIFGTGTALGSLGLQSANLSWNCRNTAQIARYAYGLIAEAPKLRAGTPEGASVTVEHVATTAEMVDAVRKTLHRLISDGLSASRIMVLSPLGTKKSPVWLARTLGNLTLVEFPAVPGPNQVQFATLQRFKGLEADAVVLCDVDRSRANVTAEHLYVAASRAKHVLVAVERQPQVR
jgi:hypothetical protein